MSLNRTKTFLLSWLLRPIDRVRWLVALMILFGAILLAAIVYEAGLSNFLRRPDRVNTLMSFLIAFFGVVFFVLASYKRGLSIGAGRRFHWLFLIIPIWLVSLATVPPANEHNTRPLEKIEAVTKFYIKFGASLLVSASIAWIIFAGGPRAAFLPISVQMALLKSDNYRADGRAFRQGAAKLIKLNYCSADDFVENGGFAWAPSKVPERVYFIYCGAFNASGRLYFDPATKEIYR